MLNYLKRRLSVGDLQGELADKREQEKLPSFLRFGISSNPTPADNYSNQTMNFQMNRPQTSTVTNPQFQDSDYKNVYTSSANLTQTSQNPYGQDYDSSTSKQSCKTFPSAPTSPTRTMGLSSIKGHISSTLMSGFNKAATTAQTFASGKLAGTQNQKNILIIDDSQIDWNRYFRGKRIAGEWDIRIEQAQLSDITLSSSAEQGCLITIVNDQTRTKPIKSFKPDYVLLRQHVSDSLDWQSLLTGLLYANVPCINNVRAIYNMKNKPWLYANLSLIKQQLGRERFPLILQSYFSNYKEMAGPQNFPFVIKLGTAHHGLGKIRVDTPIIYQDIISLIAMQNNYATIEPFIDSNCDLHIQKIGNNYKAYMRKAISGSWKSNLSSNLLEKVSINEKFKFWIDEIARLFGGLDICSVDALQSKSGDYIIYEVNGSDMNLFGDTQETDRAEIAELIIQKMSSVHVHTATIPKTPSLHSIGKGYESDRALENKPMSANVTPYHSQSSQQQAYANPVQPMKQFPMPANNPIQSTQSGQLSSVNPVSSFEADKYSCTNFNPPISSRTDSMQMNYTPPVKDNVSYQSNDRNMNLFSDNVSQSSKPAFPNKDYSYVNKPNQFDPFQSMSDSSNVIASPPSTTIGSSSNVSSVPAKSNMDQYKPSFTGSQQQLSMTDKPPITTRQTSLGSGRNAEDTDDTMKNLRKTFAGIFGDM